MNLYSILQEALEVNYSSLDFERVDREFVKKLAERNGFELVHDERGHYDSVTELPNGFHIYKGPDNCLWKVSFSEDSFSSGYFEGNCCRVKEKRVTKKVWE